MGDAGARGGVVVREEGRRLTGMDEVVLLEVGQLGEALGADVALEGPLARVRPQVDLEIRELAEGLAADVALVMHLAVLLLEGVGQGPVAPRAALGVGTEGATLRAGVFVGGEGADGRVAVVGGGGGARARVDRQARVVPEVEVVGAGHQGLIAVHLEGRGARQLVLATGVVGDPGHPTTHATTATAAAATAAGLDASPVLAGGPLLVGKAPKCRPRRVTRTAYRQR
jgi:hypothetical protein